MDEQAYKAGVLFALQRKLSSGDAFHGEGSPATPVGPAENDLKREKPLDKIPEHDYPV